MSRRLERALLAAILVAFVLLGATYSVVVPPFEASDEKWHYPMVKYVADHGALPVQVPGVETAWRQEGSQPPLYYALAAAATFWIDTSDMEAVRHLNPHAEAGATADGNVNLVVHDPDLENFPWRGTVLAVHLIRFLSILMGAASIYLTYLIAREILPGRPALALGVAAVHAFTPMFIFICGSVNNDNLVVPLSSLALLMLLRMARGGLLARGFERRGGGRWPLVASYLALGVVLGLAALTKTSALALTLLTALVVAVRAMRHRSAAEGWSEFFVGGFCTLGPFLAIAGWWFLRNLQLYGDLTGLNVFVEVLGQRAVPADLAQLWRERFSFLAGYWGNFGGLNVPMPCWVYAVLNGVALVAGMGLLVNVLLLLVHRLFRVGPGDASVDLRTSLVSFPFVLSLLWAMGVFVPWLLWARVTWSSQGRLVFPAIPVWSLLLAVGLVSWLPRRWGRRAVAALALFLLSLAVAAPFVWIAPAYALPEPLPAGTGDRIPERIGADFGGVMRLLGYNLRTGAVQPGGQVELTLYWEALSPAERDYTVFVHLLSEQELLIAQRDTFPGVGLLSTAWLEPGYRWADRYVIPVPETAYAPDEAQIAVGLYDAATGTRLPVVGDGDHVRFDRVEVRPRPGPVPNPIAVNFGDRMELVGYELGRRVVRPGEEIRLTLYWRGLRAMDANYTISAQLVGAGQRKAAHHDGWPAGGAAPTVAWQPGELVTDTRALAVFADAPLGAYDLQVAVYAPGEGGIVHLPVISGRGEMLSNRVLLTEVRVAP